MRTESVKLFFAIGVLVSFATFVMNNKQPDNSILQPIVVTAEYKQVPEFTVTVDKDELLCLAQNVYHEARGESATGMLAVAHVTVNRQESAKFPDSICGVVKQAKYSKWWKETKGKLVPIRNKCQFSWYCDGKSDAISDQRSWERSVIVALKVLVGESKDPTNGAMYYYNPSKADPYWKDSFKQVAMVDNHVFLR